MKSYPLPAPATQSDMYDYACVLELRRLNDNLEKALELLQPPTASADDEIELKESGKPKAPAKAKAS